MGQPEQNKKKQLPPKQDNEKKKKQFDNWGFYLAWGSFAAGFLAAVVSLARKSEIPKKNEYYHD